MAGLGSKIVGGFFDGNKTSEREKAASLHFGAPAVGYQRKPSPTVASLSWTRFVRAGETDVPPKENFKSSVTKNKSTGRLVVGSEPPPLAFVKAQAAKPVLGLDEYRKLWKKEKDADLVKIRKLAFEVVSLKVERPNAIDKVHSAANRVPVKVEFNIEAVFVGKAATSFKCFVFVEGISAGSGVGLKKQDAKFNAYEAALQRIFMPELRIIQLDPESRELQGQEKPFTTPPPKSSTEVLPKSSSQMPPSANKNEVMSQQKESNIEAVAVKRRLDDQRPLEDFVIVEPLVPIPDCTPSHTLRRSADFNHMLLEYEYFIHNESTRCVMKIEGQTIADMNGFSKVAAKNRAAEKGLKKLKEICWVIKTKQAVDSDWKISKEEMLTELTSGGDQNIVQDDNVGNKLLRKMGWAGGGMGKYVDGIAEPVTLDAVVNREGLGLGSARGIPDDYKRRVKELMENYASSGNQEDLVFNCDFRLGERLVIHEEARRLNLKSKCKGKGYQRYLCVSRKRSANMLIDHIMSCGGETARYKLLAPGDDKGDVPLHTVLPHGSSNKGNINKNTSSHLNKGSNVNPTTQGGRFCKNKKWEFGPPPSSLTNNRTGSHDVNSRYNIVPGRPAFGRQRKDDGFNKFDGAGPCDNEEYIQNRVPNNGRFQRPVRGGAMSKTFSDSNGFFNSAQNTRINNSVQGNLRMTMSDDKSIGNPISSPRIMQNPAINQNGRSETPMINNRGSRPLNYNCPQGSDFNNDVINNFGPKNHPVNDNGRPQSFQSLRFNNLGPQSNGRNGDFRCQMPIYGQQNNGVSQNKAMNNNRPQNFGAMSNMNVNYSMQPQENNVPNNGHMPHNNSNSFNMHNNQRSGCSDPEQYNRWKGPQLSCGPQWPQGWGWQQNQQWSQQQNSQQGNKMGTNHKPVDWAQAAAQWSQQQNQQLQT